MSAPTITSPNSVSLDENTTTVMTVTATDPDAGDILTFSLTGGADQGLLQIDANSGVLSFINAPDFESPGSTVGTNIFEVEVTADDGNGGTTAQTINVTINDVNEEPTAVALTGATAAIDENTDTAVRIKVADIAVTDDALGTNTPSLSGADAGLFEIDGTELFLSAGVVLDHEAQAALNVTVNVDDGTIPGDAGVSTDLIIAINDVNEEPTVVALTGATAAIDENTDTAVRIKVADIAVTGRCSGHEHAEPVGRRCGSVRDRRHGVVPERGRCSGP